MLHNQLEPLHSAPSPLFPPRQSIKNEGAAPGAAPAPGQKKGLVQFPNCTRNLLSVPWCTNFAQILHNFCAHPQLLQQGRFFTKMGDEQRLGQKLVVYPQIIAFRFAFRGNYSHINLVLDSCHYAGCTSVSNVDFYASIFTRPPCWLFMQSTLLTCRAGGVWVGLRIRSQLRDRSACLPACLCPVVQPPHLLHQPTRLHIVLNEQHASPPSAPYQRDVAGTDGVADNPHMACKVTLHYGWCAGAAAAA